MERSADWMAQAERDLAHARSDLAGGFYERAAFSAPPAATPIAHAEAILAFNKGLISEMDAG